MKLESTVGSRRTKVHTLTRMVRASQRPWPGFKMDAFPILFLIYLSVPTLLSPSLLLHPSSLLALSPLSHLPTLIVDSFASLYSLEDCCKSVLAPHFFFPPETFLATYNYYLLVKFTISVYHTSNFLFQLGPGPAKRQYIAALIRLVDPPDSHSRSLP